MQLSSDRDAGCELPPEPPRRALLLAGLCAAFGPTALHRDRGGSPGHRPPSNKSTQFAFEDDFTGPAGAAPDPSKWTYDLGGGGWGNNELEVYTNSRTNSFLDGDGHLVIRATKSGRTFHSARLKTIGKFAKYRGTFEARIKLDIQRGLWPAWWAIGANFPEVGWPACGEVDMLENYGGSIAETSVIRRTTRAPAYSPSTRMSRVIPAGMSGACGGTRPTSPSTKTARSI